MHVGDEFFDEQKFLGYRRWVEQTPNAYVLLNGDILNIATIGSVSDSYSGLRPQEELEKAVDLLSPIKDRILVSVAGNHERRIYKESGIDIAKILADRLGCYYAGDESYLKIRIGSKRGHQANGKPVVYTIFMQHGHRGGRTVGAKINAIAAMASTCLAEIYIGSHIHSITAHVDLYLVPEIRANKIVEMKRTFISSGAFLGRGGYGVTHAFPASKLGSAKIRLDGTRHDVHISL